MVNEHGADDKRPADTADGADDTMMTPEPSHDVSALRRGVNAKLGETPDSIDMEAPATVVGQETKYRGAIFHVDDMELALAKRDGGTVHIHRQIVRHPGAVVMLVHDVRRDRYLVEREYRVGPNGFAYGIPAGLMDEGETARQAALRELREETGVVPETEDSIRIRRIARTYSSEGMTDERSYVLGIDLDGWTQGARHFDRDEHVQSAWVSWEELQGVGLMGANSIIAIQSEQLRRLRAEPDR